MFVFNQNNNNYLNKIIILFFSILFLSCTQSGVQGSGVFSSFNGISKIEALSPTTIQISWSLDSKYTEYRIYQNSNSTPIKTETFSMTKINKLQPNTAYSFSMSAFSADSGEVFVGDPTSVNTIASFEGLLSKNVVLKSATDIFLQWNQNSSTATYKIYKKLQQDNWNFNTPETSITNSDQYTISNLVIGNTYCFYITAHYADDSVEPEETTTSANANGSCLKMTAPMDSLPTISISSNIPGKFSWFTAANGNEQYKIDVFDSATDTRVASRIGNGYFRSFTEVLQGRHQYYALISSATNISKIPVSITGTKDQTHVNFRSLNDIGNLGPIYPPVFSNGLGIQNMGQQIVSGDFNCDGLTDIAISVDSSTPINTTDHFSQSGGVIIYYGYQPPIDPSNPTVIPNPYLKTDVAPSISNQYPNPLLITYPVTENNVGLGFRMAVGNINNDCRYNMPNPDPGGAPISMVDLCEKLIKPLPTPLPVPSILPSQVYSCDDLVIQTKNGKSLFVIYGDPVFGLVAGSGGNTFGINETTCDPSSFTCRASEYTAPTGFSFVSPNQTFEKSIAIGDFNNDGFADLAVTLFTTTGTGTNRVAIMSGSSSGLTPLSTFGSTNYNTTYILPNSASSSNNLIKLGNSPNTTATENFGLALGAALGSRRCINAGTTKYRAYQPLDFNFDFTMCDDLIIGAPDRIKNTPTTGASTGSIFACEGILPVANSPEIRSWLCSEHWPADNNIIPQRYGASILGVRNQNGFPVKKDYYQNTTSTPAYNDYASIPTTAGALFVGAPNTTVLGNTNAGAVFEYLVTPRMVFQGASLSPTNPGIRYVLANGSYSAGNYPSSYHSIDSINQVACDAVNGNKTDSTNKPLLCNNLIFYPSPVQSNSKFGATLSSTPTNIQKDEVYMPYLAVSAPYRKMQSSGGSAASDNAGIIYLYQPDSSTYDGVTDSKFHSQFNYANLNSINNESCYIVATPTNCNWFSGGISPNNPTLVYPSNLNANANFGIGGVAGGHFSNNGTSFGEIITTAPNFNLPVANNGGAFLFSPKNAGSFSPIENLPTATFMPNVSFESNYHFDQAKVVGDINGDGYEDVVTHIFANGRWQLVVYYGSVNGLITTPAPALNALNPAPQLIQPLNDLMIGKFFYKIGDVNGDGFADILAVSDTALYIYYGSSAGLVASIEPNINPIGKNPLKFGIAGGDISLFGSNLTLSRSATSTNLFEPVQNAVAFGDFNKDGYSDIAIGTMSGSSFIIYGSQIGPNVNRVTGKLNLSDIDTDGSLPCTSGTNCKVQQIPMNGFALTVLPSKVSGNSYSYDELVLSDNSTNINIYRGGLNGIDSSSNGLVQTINGIKGYALSNLGDVNKDGFDDLAISDGANKVYILYGNNVNGVVKFVGVDGSNHLTTLNDNKNSTATTDLTAQVLNITSSLTTAHNAGQSMAAIGDFNNDGYNDIIVNVPNGDYNLNGSALGTGYSLVYFGGPNGIQVQNKTISDSPKCYGGVTPVCEPYLIYLPNYSINEYTNISDSSCGDINGDGFKDIVIGGFGRLHPTGKVIAGGVIYVLY